MTTTPPARLRIAVVTVVHHPLDARIHARQIEAMLRAGHAVTYAAPFTATNTPMDTRLHCHDLPRARLRNRVAAVRAAAAWLRSAVQAHDVVIVHDPELVPALIRQRGRCTARLIWDVHEDNPAAISRRHYIPVALRSLAATAMRRLERRAEGNLTLLLAEADYQERFSVQHPHVPNTPWVSPLQPAARSRRVVYVGSITTLRGSEELCRLGALLAPTGIELHLIGPIDDAVSAETVAAAVARGEVRAHGRMDNTEALHFVRESLAGLSLLRDVPNHRHSMPTKVLEYAAVGTPVITTALPLAAAVVTQGPAGTVIPFGSVDAVAEVTADAVLRLDADPELVQRYGAQGYSTVERAFNWNHDSQAFLRVLQGS